MRYLLALLLTSYSLIVVGQSFESQIDSLLVPYKSTTDPGFAVGVVKEGNWLYKKGFGMANLEHQIPNSPTTVFRIASTSKQFTAACILMLERQGKLSLDDKLNKFFPAFPDYAKNISLKHLLHHTSGVRDYLMLSYLAGMRDDDFYTDDEIMQWLENQKALNFEPGAQFTYSNSGYWLLGQIVEQVSGVSLADYAAEHLFAPLKMTNTHFHDKPNLIVPNRASGYTPNSQGAFERCETTLPMVGDGGIFTTIEDFNLWTKELHTHEVFGKEFWEHMFERGTLNNGESIDYAMGLTHSEQNGNASIGHGGAFVGFLSKSISFPEQEVSVIIFCNRNDVSPSRLAQNIADIVLPAPSDNEPTVAQTSNQKEPRPKKNPKLSEKELSFFEGYYRSDDGRNLHAAIVEDTLRITQLWNSASYPIVPISNTAFEIPDYNGLVFEFAQEKKTMAHSLSVQQGSQRFEYTRFSFSPLSVDSLKAYEGSYYSKELLLSYQVALKDDHLEVKIGNHEPFVLSQTDNDTFSGRGIMIYFEVKRNYPTGFVIEAGRVQGIQFIRS